MERNSFSPSKGFPHTEVSQQLLPSSCPLFRQLIKGFGSGSLSFLPGEGAWCCCCPRRAQSCPRGTGFAHLSPPRACWVSPSLISALVSSSPVWQENIQKVPLTRGVCCDPRQALIIQHSTMKHPRLVSDCSQQIQLGCFHGRELCYLLLCTKSLFKHYPDVKKKRQ